MKDKKIKSAIAMYTKSIKLLEKEKDKISHGEMAIIFCNRSATWVYLKEYQKAVDDAVFALKYDPLLTKAWIRKGMAEQELKRFKVAYGDYQVALNQSTQSDNYYPFLLKRIGKCFEEIVVQHSQPNTQTQTQHHVQAQTT